MFTAFLVLISLILAGMGVYYRIVYENQEEKKEKEAFHAKVDADLRARDAQRQALLDQAQADLQLKPIALKEIPLESRIEHAWVVAGTGQGKTQLLQQLIADDIPRILNGERSVIVIDSQRKLIPLLAGLDIWRQHPHRLTHITPWEVDHPVALNLFNLDLPEDRQEAHRKLIGLKDGLRFIINTILADATLSGKQALIFDNLLLLMSRIPNANMLTYLDLLTDEGFAAHRQYVEQLSGAPRAFFDRDYITGQRNDQYQGTREEVRRRIQQMLSNPTFDGMFCQPARRLHLGEEMDAGRLILLDTDKSELGETDSPLIGGLFVGLVYQEVLARARDDYPLPCLVYIDECFEYFEHTAPQLSMMLKQARKRNIGLTLAHQDLGDLKSAAGLFSALAGNTSIKMAGGTSDSDASTLASMLSTEPERIQHAPKLQFVTSVKGIANSAKAFTTTPGIIEDMPRMDRSAYQAMRRQMHERYAAPPYTPPPRSAPPPPAPKKKTKAKLETDPRDYS